MENFTPVNIKITDIIIGDKRRPVGNIDSLTKDIEKIGLMYAVILTPDKKLVAGARRIASFLRLGRDHIPAVIKNYNEIEAKIAEISDNLENMSLNPLQKIRALAMQKEYYQALYPETSKKARTTANLPNNPQQNENDVEQPTYSKFIAKQVDKDVRTVQGWIKAGENLTDEICERLKDRPIANNYSDLKQLSAMPEEYKMQAVNFLEAGAHNKIREFKAYILRQFKDRQVEPSEPKEGEDFMFSASVAFGLYENEIKHCGDNSFDLCLTDPPYAVNKKKKGKKQTWDEKFDVVPFLNEIYRVLEDSGSALIFCSDRLLADYLMYPVNNPGKLHLRQILHWHKTNRKGKPAEGDRGTRRYLDTIEYILWFTKNEHVFTFNPSKINQNLCGNTQTAYFRNEDENDDSEESRDDTFISGICAGGERLTDDNGDSLHDCQKPYALVESLLRAHSNRGDKVFDPFAGSGTVAECAAHWERSYLGIEMDPEYHARANMRLKLALGFTEVNGRPDEWDEAYADDVVIRDEFTPEDEARYISDMARMQEQCENGTAPERLQKMYQANIDAGYQAFQKQNIAPLVGGAA